MSGQIAVGRAEGYQGEVEALHQEELLHVDIANLNMAAVRVDIAQANRTRRERFHL